MKKLISYGLPALLLSLFVAVMTTANILKQPFGESDQVEKYIIQLEIELKKEKWENAEMAVNKLDSAWQKVRKRVQFSVERGEIIGLNRLLARLKGSINAQDKNTALADLYEVKEIWNDLAG